MIDKILDKYGRNAGNNANDIHANEEVEVEDLGTFGFLRGSRERATMLELRKRDGSILAIGYGWLEKVAFDPTDGIILHVLGQKIRIRGRNLNVEVHPKVRLFEAICRHRVPWLQEVSDHDCMAAKDGHIVIEAIDC